MFGSTQEDLALFLVLALLGAAVFRQAPRLSVRFSLEWLKHPFLSLLAVLILYLACGWAGVLGAYGWEGLIKMQTEGAVSWQATSGHD